MTYFPDEKTDFATLPKHRVGSIQIISITPGDAVRQIINKAMSTEGGHIHLVNAYTVALADKSREYRKIFDESSLNFPDGKPLTWISKIHGFIPKLIQVRGPQLFLDVFDEGRRNNIRHYLLGGTPETSATLFASLTRNFPGVKIVGYESPDFRSLTKHELINQDLRIKASKAQIVWVGLGTPKQDFEARRIAQNLPVVAIAIGAAFDFAAGTKQQAPKWMRRVGLEWLFRLIIEPRRLWKRYLFGNIRFLYATLFPRPLPKNEIQGLKMRSDIAGTDENYKPV